MLLTHQPSQVNVSYMSQVSVNRIFTQPSVRWEVLYRLQPFAYWCCREFNRQGLYHWAKASLQQGLKERPQGTVTLHVHMLSGHVLSIDMVSHITVRNTGYHDMAIQYIQLIGWFRRHEYSFLHLVSYRNAVLCPNFHICSKFVMQASPCQQVGALPFEVSSLPQLKQYTYQPFSLLQWFWSSMTQILLLMCLIFV